MRWRRNSLPEELRTRRAARSRTLDLLLRPTLPPRLRCGAAAVGAKRMGLSPNDFWKPRHVAAFLGRYGEGLKRRLAHGGSFVEPAQIARGERAGPPPARSPGGRGDL
jgi:hypothetical protein